MATTESVWADTLKRTIREMVELGGSVAEEMGADPAGLERFLSHYFRHVDVPVDTARPARTMVGQVRAHYELALSLTPGTPKVRVWRPTEEVDGWSVRSVVAQVVVPDQPFLVDTMSMEILRQGWQLVEVLHPQFLVVRDETGKLQEVVGSDRADEPGVTDESWMHFEIRPPAGVPAEQARTALMKGLLEVLELAREAYEDWPAMRAKLTYAVDCLQDRPQPVAFSRVRSACDLLNWLAEDHFTFLGYAEYNVERGGESDYHYQRVAGSGLGILRGDANDPHALHAVPTGSGHPTLIVVTKDNRRSRVHRPAYLDYVGVRLFDEHGALVEERRFLGLFAASAETESALQIPWVKDKANWVLAHSGYDLESHGSKAIRACIEAYPRNELFQVSAEELAPQVERIAAMRERRQVRIFLRVDPYKRFVSCQVYLPRDRYSTQSRQAIDRILRKALGGGSTDFTARANESVLARLHYVVHLPPGQAIPPFDSGQLEAAIVAAAQTWDDHFAAEIEDNEEQEELARLGVALPESYKEQFAAHHARLDLEHLLALSGEHDMSMVLYTPDALPGEDDAELADLRLKIFRVGATMSLAKVLPQLTKFGVTVLDERPHELELPGDERGIIYDLGLGIRGGRAARNQWIPAARQRFIEAFEASYRGRTESDLLNGLVIPAALNWREVNWLRMVSHYLRQIGSPYSQEYIATSLLAEPMLARLLVALFRAKFDPQVEDADRQELVDQRVAEILSSMDSVESLDHDRIVRSFLAVIQASVRTNAFRSDRMALALKLIPTEIPEAPAPRPAYEIFVCSPVVEGVHLRFGRVARGGLRWSDRREDYRTEVLGLVKAQIVKNTVIVPVGAKGGFYPRRLPDESADRNAWFEAGRQCYRIFVNSLLDLTDNIVDGEIVPPSDVVRHDGDDPYLVIAADKGTATFSDTANALSKSRGYWLGDAFASGGSAGYDHKAMGITARGAWVSVRRHFREMGIDCQNEDFTCVGIGDMSGDVFGNGMLLSHHNKLVAAFNHRHIFLDPDPDPETSWKERQRLYTTPRTGWGDYSTDLISSGGGVYSRQQKSIPVSPEVRRALGLDESVEALAPPDMIRAILRAPVDLLWNGGIGTYVKATPETDAEVGDRSNDALRVDAAELRCNIIGEGGNLGVTQRGRVEYATAGGRINTDFIDNSAGVDTSDHEVNIKILLGGEVAAGRMTGEERDELLESLTDHIAELVLAHNYDQNITLANAASQAAPMAGVHSRYMNWLAEIGELDRTLAALPSSKEMVDRMARGRGLTPPELATLLSTSKLLLEKEVLDSDLPEDPYVSGRLQQYFPEVLRDRFPEAIAQHRLRREIITTVAVNRYVNSSGISAGYRLVRETGASLPNIMRAQVASRAILGVGVHERACNELDNQVDAAVQTRVRIDLREMVERSARHLLSRRAATFDVGDVIERYHDGVQALLGQFVKLLQGRAAKAYQERCQLLISQGIPDELAQVVAGAPLYHQSISIVDTVRTSGQDLETVAAVQFWLTEDLQLDLLRDKIASLPRQDRWDSMARAALRDDLYQVQADLTSAAVATLPEHPETDNGVDPQRLVGGWLDTLYGLDMTRRTLAAVNDLDPDVARLSVAVRQARSLLDS